MKCVPEIQNAIDLLLVCLHFDFRHLLGYNSGISTKCCCSMTLFEKLDKHFSNFFVVVVAVVVYAQWQSVIKRRENNQVHDVRLEVTFFFFPKEKRWKWFLLVLSVFFSFGNKTIRTLIVCRHAFQAFVSDRIIFHHSRFSRLLFENVLLQYEIYMMNHRT